MKINKLNYEVYAIDYLDGTLSEEMTTEMEQFMQSHPDIADSLAMFDEIVLTPDLSVTYSAKDDLKKPIRFAVLNYMNWIIPISLSIAFMVAYPYIRTIWHDDQPQNNIVKTVNVESTALNEQPRKAETVIAQNTIKIKKTDKSRRVKGVELSEAEKIENTSISNSNNSLGVFTPSNSTSFNSENEYEKEIAKNNALDHQHNNTVNEKEQSILTLTPIQKDIIKIEKSVKRIESISDLKKNEIDLLELENELKLAEQNQEYSPLTVKPSFERYLTFTVSPYSLGYDLAKTTNISAENQLVRHLIIDNHNKIELQSPKQFGGLINIHFSPCFELSSGFSITDRNLTYVPSNADGAPVLDLENINYKTYSVPLKGTFKLPLGTKGLQTLNIQSGLAINWMGDRNFAASNNGSINNEKVNTAGLLKTTDDYSKMVTTNDDITFVPAIQFGLAYEKQLKNAGSLIFAFEYNRQMGNINNIRIWDYDLDNEMRSDINTAYKMRFETISASVKYTLPFKVAIK